MLGFAGLATKLGQLGQIGVRSRDRQCHSVSINLKKMHNGTAILEYDLT